MTKIVDRHDAVGVIAQVPGVGIMLAYSATTATAGTAGYAPGCLLITTTTKKAYVNEGNAVTASWAVAGSQS